MDDTKKTAYFDNAATTFPKPDCVYNFMNEFYRTCGGNAGRGNYFEAQSSLSLIFETRKLILDLFHCPSRQAIFTPSATVALNMIIQGLVKKGAKNIYISPFEHNAVTRVLHSFGDSINVKILEVSKTLDYDFEKIKSDFENEKPDLVIATHASNVIGFVQPVEEIFTLAKNYGAVTVLDMAQTAGLVDITLANEIFDFAVFAGHKTLYGPTGIGGFVMKKDFDLPPVLFGGTGFESANKEMPSSLPERFEAGTQNILGIAGLNAALEWIKNKRITNIYSQENHNRGILEEILKKYSYIKLIGNSMDKEYTGIISCLIDSIPSDIADNIFSERNISVRTGLQCAPEAHRFLCTYPTGTIRFSCSYFTNDEDFIALGECLDYIGEEI